MKNVLTFKNNATIFSAVSDVRKYDRKIALKIKGELESDSRFGGVYFDAEGTLNVCVTEAAAAEKYELISRVSKVKHSLKTLADVYRKISCRLPVLDGVNGVAVSVYSNTIELFTDSTDISIIKEKIKGITAFPFEDFILTQSAGFEKNLRAYPGRAVNYGFLRLMRGTVGFNARDNASGKTGIVTNAHVARPQRQLYYNLFFKLGMQAKGKDGGNVDCAFIPLAGNFDTASVLKYGLFKPPIRIAGTTEFIEGDTVDKYGAASGHTCGKVKNTDASIKYSDGSTLHDLVFYSNESKGGDSGAPFGKNGDEGFEIGGIHIALNKSSGMSAGCKIANVLQYLDVSLIKQ